MNPYLVFRLKEHYRNRSAVIRVIAVFFLTGFLMFSDHLFHALQYGMKLKIYPDSSVPVQLIDNPFFHITDNGEEADLRISYDAKWKIVSKKALSEKDKLELLLLLSASKNPEMIEEPDFQEEVPEDHTMILLLLTFLYFEAISKSSVIAGEIIDDKLSGMDGTVLSSMTPRSHMNVMIGYAWVTRIVDAVLLGISISVWGSVRLITVGLPVTFTASGTYSGNSVYLLPVLLMALPGMWLSHRIMAVYVAKIHHPDEAAGYLILPNAIFLAGYFLMTEAFDTGNILVLKICGCIPVLNGLSLPLLYIQGEYRFMFVGIGLLIMYILVICLFADRWYKARITE